MARYEEDIPISGDGRVQTVDHDEPIGNLLRRFGQDGALLVRQEIALAKLELAETAKGYARDASKMGAAATLAWFGATALVAFVILGLGALLDNYWLSSLIVALVLLATAAVLARGALQHMKRNSFKPEQTMQTLREDKVWAQHEVREFKQKIKA